MNRSEINRINNLKEELSWEIEKRIIINIHIVLTHMLTDELADEFSY